MVSRSVPPLKYPNPNGGLAFKYPATVTPPPPVPGSNKLKRKNPFSSNAAENNKRNANYAAAQHLMAVRGTLLEAQKGRMAALARQRAEVSQRVQMRGGVRRGVWRLRSWRGRMVPVGLGGGMWRWQWGGWARGGGRMCRRGG